jgi:hypothetical protein
MTYAAGDGRYDLSPQWTPRHPSGVNEATHDDLRRAMTTAAEVSSK